MKEVIAIGSLRANVTCCVTLQINPTKWKSFESLGQSGESDDLITRTARAPGIGFELLRQRVAIACRWIARPLAKPTSLDVLVSVHFLRRG